MPRPETLEVAQVLQALTHTPARASALTAQLGVSRATVHRKLEKLLEQDLIVRVGEGPQAAYRLPTVQEELERSRKESAGERQVRLVMTADAAGAVQNALELFGRIGIGQLGEIASMARFTEIRRADGTPLDHAQLDEADRLSDSLKFHLLGLDANASFGIYSSKVHPSVLRTWGLHRALRHRLAWDRQPKGSMGVWHDEPLGDDNLLGLFVHSDLPDEKGVATRYVIEMPGDCVALMRGALRVALRVCTGDVQAVVDLARDQVLRSQSGAPVSADALQKGELLAGALGAVLSGVDKGAYNALLTKSQVNILQVLSALEQFEKSGAESVSGTVDEARVTVGPVGDSPWAVSLDELPEGMMLNYKGGKYRVIAPSHVDNSLAIVAESHSLKTAVQMAKNRAEGRREREFGY